MTAERYVTGFGQGLNWGNAITGSNLNSLGSSNCLLSDIQIDNSISLDMFSDVSAVFGSQTWVAGGVDVLLYPLNQDGSTYGDGQFVSSGSNTAGTEYYCGTFFIPATGGAQTMTGAVRGIVIPPGKFKFVFCTFGNGLPSSGNSIKYRTYNRSIV